MFPTTIFYKNGSQISTMVGISKLKFRRIVHLYLDATPDSVQEVADKKPKSANSMNGKGSKSADGKGKASKSMDIRGKTSASGNKRAKSAQSVSKKPKASKSADNNAKSPEGKEKKNETENCPCFKEPKGDNGEPIKITSEVSLQIKFNIISLFFSRNK